MLIEEDVIAWPRVLLYKFKPIFFVVDSCHFYNANGKYFCEDCGYCTKLLYCTNSC